jgi:tetratricopeptide (TPR) repeat protein
MSALTRFSALLAATLAFAPALQAQTQPAPAPDALHAAAPSISTPVDAARAKIVDAVKKMNQTPSDIDGALAALSQAIQLKPDSVFAYQLRGSLYTQKKAFPQAEADFNNAYKLDPDNVVIKFNLSELKFMQKDYDQARTGFVPLQKDADMGDFAMYKVFLCDLYAGHEAVAKSELNAINDKGDDASYYFSNAAWDLYHKNIEDARTWLVSASHIYDPKKFTTYGATLRYLGYLPLPLPKDGSVNPNGSPASP